MNLNNELKWCARIIEGEHLAVGSLGTVKMLCIYMNGKEELETMCGLRMDDDAEEGTWQFFGYELKAVK